MADFETEAIPGAPAPEPANNSPNGGRGLGRGRSGRGLGRGRSGRGRGVSSAISKRASNAFMEDNTFAKQEEDEETKRRNRARTHECVTHLASDPQPQAARPAPAPLEKTESKKFMRGTRKAMAKLTGIHGSGSKKNLAPPA